MIFYYARNSLPIPKGYQKFFVKMQLDEKQLVAHDKTYFMVAGTCKV